MICLTTHLRNAGRIEAFCFEPLIINGYPSTKRTDSAIMRQYINLCSNTNYLLTQTTTFRIFVKSFTKQDCVIAACHALFPSFKRKERKAKIKFIGRIKVIDYIFNKYMYLKNKINFPLLINIIVFIQLVVLIK